MHPPFGAGKLVFDRQFGRGRRRGIGHFEHAGHPAQNRRAAAGFQIFLVLVAGLAEMHLGVDDTGQDVQPLRIKDLGGLRGGQPANRGDAPALHTHIGRRNAGWGGADTPTDQKIECLAHGLGSTLTHPAWQPRLSGLPDGSWLSSQF